MNLHAKTIEQPDFIVKSTIGVTLVSIILLTPFGIYNLTQGRYILAALILMISFLSIINVLICVRGQYYWQINLLSITPVIFLVDVLAIIEFGVMGSFWTFLAVLAFFFILPERLAWLICCFFMAIIFPVAWVNIDHSISIRFMILLLTTTFFAAIFIRIITKQQNQLKELAITDPLTGLYNRFLLQSTLQKGIDQYHRSGIPITLLMLDIDHFKSINDDLGHDVGDTVLKSVGIFLKNYFSESDMVFRTGGEEFLVLMYNLDEKDSRVIAEKLRTEFEKLLMLPDRKFTASIGISGFVSGLGLEEWMKYCDKNLYLAKSSGRNQVVS